MDGVGNLYIADQNNNRIRKVDTSGIISTVAGSGGPEQDPGGYSGDGGLATEARLKSPSGVFVDRLGDLYIADAGNYRIRRVADIAAFTPLIPVSAAVDTIDLVPALADTILPAVIASSPRDGEQNVDPEDANRQGIRIAFSEPVDTAGVQVRFQAGKRLLNWYRLWSTDGDSLLVLRARNGEELDFGTDYRLTLSQVSDKVGNVADDRVLTFSTRSAPADIVQTDTISGIITTVAGNGIPGYSGDGGPAIQALLNGPQSAFVDTLGNIYIADRLNHRIRKIDTSGAITTVAGNGSKGFSGDGGPATQAHLNGPFGVYVDAVGNLYIADTDNHRIRYIADQFNHRIRKVRDIAALTPLSGGVFDPIPDTTAADDEPPVLVFSTPRNGAFVHPDSVVVALTFSEPIDTVGAILRVTANGQDQLWRAVLEVDSVLVFTPMPGVVTYDTDYRIHLSKIADRSGNIAADIVVGFVTILAPADTVPPDTTTVPPDTTTIFLAESLITIDFDPSPGDQERHLTVLSGGGQSVEVQLNIRDALLINGWSAEISYDPQQLRYVPGSFQPSTFIPGLVVLVDDGEKDKIEVGGVVLGDGTGRSGDGTLGTLSFDIPDDFVGRADLTITIISLRFPTGEPLRASVDAPATVAVEPAVGPQPAVTLDFDLAAGDQGRRIAQIDTADGIYALQLHSGSGRRKPRRRRLWRGGAGHRCGQRRQRRVGHTVVRDPQRFWHVLPALIDGNHFAPRRWRDRNNTLLLHIQLYQF